MTTSSSREFVGKVARRAVYSTPMLMALSSRRAYAGVSGCGQDGSICYGDNDCCNGWNCVNNMGNPIMMGMMGMCG